MAYRVVCISPTDGSAGAQVGQIVARELGFQFLDEEIVERAAREAGVDAAAVADAERRKTLSALVRGALGDPGRQSAAAPATGPPAHGRNELGDFIRAVIWESGQRGDAVIAAHAASFALAGRSDVLRVWISASPETRAQRVAAERGVSHAEAEKLIARGDAGRGDYLKRFYGVSTETPRHYDITLNTDRISPEDVASLIVTAARSAPVAA